MINLKDREAKNRYHAYLIRQFLAIERNARKNLKPLLLDKYNKAAYYVKIGDRAAINSLKNITEPEYQLVSNLYKRSITAFSGILIKDIDKYKHSQKSLLDSFWDRINKWLIMQTIFKLNKINNTTIKTIDTIINRNEQEQKTDEEIAKDISSKGKIISKSRAIAIARTEAHTAGNLSMLEVSKASGIEMKKEWLNAGDLRVRDIHENSQINPSTIIPVDQVFFVGGVPMMYPGDPSGGLNNIINCRCVLLYHVV
jgi:hypothetical protein